MARRGRGKKVGKRHHRGTMVVPAHKTLKHKGSHKKSRKR